MKPTTNVFIQRLAIAGGGSVRWRSFGGIASHLNGGATAEANISLLNVGVAILCWEHAQSSAPPALTALSPTASGHLASRSGA